MKGGIFMNPLNNQPLFFLGANSPKGFVSHFADNYRNSDGWHTYIIKGGAGTGKSTLLKKVADYFISMGISAHLCPCSSDISSLDAVIFPDIKIMLLDGTAPHVVEAEYFGACEEIINLADALDPVKLKEMREDIIALSAKNSAYHKRASAYLSAAGAVLADTKDTATACLKRQKTTDYGIKLAKKFAKKTNSKPIEWVRYLSAITPRGEVFYRNTLKKTANEIIILSDEYGAAAPAVLSAVRNQLLAMGHEIITCYCPFFPDSKIEHILVPSLSLAFCTSCRHHHIDTTDSSERTIHARRFLDVTKMHQNKHVFAYNKKASAMLIDMAVSALADAKGAHDKLELCYRDAINFDFLNSTAKTTVQKILRFM